MFSLSRPTTVLAMASVVLSLLGVLLLPAGAHEGHDHGDERPHEHEVDLASPIDRSALRPDVSQRVTEEALVLANSPVLAESRAVWGDDESFVHQVAYQLRFRSATDYLSVEPSHLAAVLSDRTATEASEWLNLYMTVEESAEFGRRQLLGDRMPDVARVLGVPEAEEGLDPVYPSTFAGIWQDQLDGGRIVVAVTDRTTVDAAEVATVAGGSGNVSIIEVPYSWDEVNAYRDALVRALAAEKVPASVEIDSLSNGRRIEIVAPNPSDVTESILSAAPEGLVSVSAGDVGETGAPDTTHSAADQMPGLRIEFDPGGWCTWGTNGHTNTYNYLVTAGHCGGDDFDDFLDSTTVMEIHQNNSRLLTSGSVFVYSRNVDGWDMKRVSSTYADDNCYHGETSHCSLFIKYRALHNSWETGSDTVCASLGNSSDHWDCGFVLETNYSGGSGACSGNRFVRYDIPTIGGDSGAGLVGQVIGETPALSIDAIQHCKTGSTSYGNTAYDVKTRLAFDFNCASSAVTGRAANAWGACPTIDR